MFDFFTQFIFASIFGLPSYDVDATALNLTETDPNPIELLVETTEVPASFEVSSIDSNNLTKESLSNLTEEKLYLVIAVIDGDTLLISDEVTRETFQVRLLAVDTQEVNGLDSTAECGAYEATLFTTEFLKNRLVRLRIDEANQDEDPSGRKLRYVDAIQDDGSFLNLNKALVEEGYATFPSEYPITYPELFSTLESQAQKESKGLWGYCEDGIDLW
jgi:endonuclease YncB( thermonuclease family)